MQTIRCYVTMSGALLLGLSACHSSQPSQSASPATTEKPAFRNVTSVKQLMGWIIEPNADVVWAAVGSSTSKDGEQKFAPKTEQEWNAVRNAAAIVAESGNLLMMEGRAREGGDWLAMTRTMMDKANESLQAAEAKDVDGVFTAGGDLYEACTACHAKYLMNQPAAK
jgi:hypothetical protein